MSHIAEVRVQKVGPNGRPYAELSIPNDVTLEQLVGLQKVVVRDLRKIAGLKGCQACLSGLDLDIRRRFDDVIRLDVRTGTKVGI